VLGELLVVVDFGCEFCNFWQSELKRSTKVVTSDGSFASV